MFCDADFEGGICCNPGSNPAVLRIQGITTPEGANFVFYDPAPQSLKLPALRAEVDEPGRLRPRLFLLPFFHTGPAPRPRKRRPRIFAESGPHTPWKPSWGRDPTQPFKRPHRGLRGQTTGILLLPPFSLYRVLVFDMPDQKPLINFIPYILRLNVDFSRSFHYNDFTQ